MRMPRRITTVLGLVVGAAGLVFFVHLLLTTDGLERLRDLPPALLLLVPAWGVVAIVNTVSWREAFPRESDGAIPPFRALFAIRLAGESINNALASAYVAGEPVKGILTARYGTRPAVGLASALIGKTTNVLGEVLFLFLGALVAFLALEAQSAVVRLLFVVAGVGLAIVAVGVLLQSRRLFGRGARLLKALKLGPARLWDRALPGADAIDAAIRAYYGRQRGAFLASTLLALLGWLLGAAELWVFLAVATPAENPLVLALVLEAGIAVVKGLSFFVPASIGVQEGGIASLFQATGLGLEAGVAYAVFRRVRELFWIALGFAALARITAKEPAAW